jgi:uncharacterized protein (UPF0332 family)
MIELGSRRQEHNMSTEEIQLYLDRAHQDLEAAESNLHHGFYGVTVARAYYATFYATSALLASRRISRSKHSDVLSTFGKHFVRAGLMEPEFAKMLGHAFDSRLDSDYDLMFVADRTLAEDLYSDAQSLVQRAERHLRQQGAP